MGKKQQLPRRLDAPIYTFRQALYMAFYSRRLYVDVVRRWRGFGFFYLMLLIAVACVPLSARFVLQFNHFVNEQMIEPLEQIPPLQVQHGEISSDKPMPYFVRSKTGDVVAMIDTRTNGKGMDGTFPELMMLVTKDKFYFRPPFPGASRDKAIHNVIEREPDANTTTILVMSEWVKSSGILNLKWMLDGMIYPVLTSYMFGILFSLFMVMAMMAQVFSWLVLRYKLTYKESCRLLIVSSTVVVSVLMLLWAANITFPGLTATSLGVSILYFIYGVLSVKRESYRMVRS